MKYKWYQFDPMKSFLSLPILWVVVITFVLLATVTAGTIALNSNLELSLSYSGFNRFITMFKVPLGILALIIPVVALLAANHRSEQTKAQITSNTQQNKFSNFYKHVEEFEKYIEANIDTANFTIPSIRQAHRLLFPSSFDGDFSIGQSVLKHTNDLSSDLVSLIGHFHGGHPTTEEGTVFRIQEALQEMESTLGILSTIKQRAQLEQDGKTIAIAKPNLVDLFSRLKSRIAFVHTILSFDHHFVPSEEMSKLIRINLKNVANHNFIENKEAEAPPFDPFI